MSLVRFNLSLSSSIVLFSHFQALILHISFASPSLSSLSQSSTFLSPFLGQTSSSPFAHPRRACTSPHFLPPRQKNARPFGGYFACLALSFSHLFSITCRFLFGTVACMPTHPLCSSLSSNQIQKLGWGSPLPPESSIFLGKNQPFLHMWQPNQIE